MKKNKHILIALLIILFGCRTNKILDSKSIDYEELELWMINHSPEIKKMTRSSFFKISNPQVYNHEKLIQDIADSLNITAVQKLNINNDQYEDLLVCGTKIPYLIINKKKPKILKIRRAPRIETLALATKDNKIKIFEMDYGLGNKSIREYDLIIWNEKLIEPSTPHKDLIKKMKYIALGYERRIFEIDMKGEILFFDYTGKFSEDESGTVWLKTGKISKKNLKKLADLFNEVNFREIKPKHIGELHTQNVKIEFTTSTDKFELKDNGKRGTFSLIAYYNILDEIIDSTEFENIKSFNLKSLYENHLNEIFEIFKIKN